MTAERSRYGTGGPYGSRVFWPAGLQEKTPQERATALEIGWWFDGDVIITRDGRRLEGEAKDEFLKEHVG